MRAPAFTAWLAITGRSLAVVGRLLQSAVPLLEATVAAPGHPLQFDALLETLEQYHPALLWLAEMLSQLQQAQGSTSPPPAAVRVDSNTLQQLAQQASQLARRVVGLLPNRVFSSERRVFELQCGFVASCGDACKQGWLPQGLQDLGVGVWSAFPQSFACNEPSCLNLEGLTESSCAKKCCTGCKVGGCVGGCRLSIGGTGNSVAGCAAGISVSWKFLHALVCAELSS